jgi:predicted transcriptional regulator of viral defense system
VSALADYVDELQANGHCVFTTQHAVKAIGGSESAVRAALRRLKRKGVIADPFRGFHVVVPPTYRRLGCLPAEQFIPELMEHLGEPYYAGLLTAAQYHGAAHQTPMVFQLIVPESRRDIRCGEVRVEFIARQDMRETPIVKRNTQTGFINIATPEATAIELIGYPEHCGYLDNVATVLSELAETMRGEQLVLAARRAPVAWIQRLGFVLSFVEENELAEQLESVLSERNTFTVALAPWKEMIGVRRDSRWNVAVNVELTPDL